MKPDWYRQCRYLSGFKPFAKVISMDKRKGLKNIRIYECVGGIEKSVPRITNLIFNQDKIILREDITTLTRV